MLIVDDDADLQSLIKMELEASHYQVIAALDGAEGLEVALRESPDLIILDVNLPTLDGLTVCRELRGRSPVPILMLSSLGKDYDKIVGLEVGADDYLGKPFNPRELLARVRALLRRVQRPSEHSPANPQTELVHGPFRLNTLTHECRSQGQRLALTPLEFELLKTFLLHPGQVLSRQRLLDRVWGHDFVGTERTVDTHMRNLRQKLGDEGRLIESVRGIGFKLI